MLLAAPVAAAALPAQTEISQDERAAGLWYADRMKFDQIREQGLTGKGIKIAVIDSAINLDAPELQGASIDVRGQFCRNKETGEEPPAVSDELVRRHGTDVVSMLVGNGVAGDGGAGTQGIVPDAEVLFYAVGAPEDSLAEGGGMGCEAYNAVTGEFESDDPRGSSDPAEFPINNPTALAARQAIADGADIISISIVESVFAAGWELTQIHAMRAGVPIVAGSTNPTASGTVEYLLPFGMNGVVAVGGVDADAKPIRGLNIYGTDIEDARGASNLAVAGPALQMLAPSSDEGWGPSLGSGTSLATPLIAGTIALGLEKYPSATASQVIQTLIRTTGGDGLSELNWSNKNFGYGIVNATGMLAVDPTQFPDENPLYVMTADDPRCGGAATYETCKWAVMLPKPAEIWPAGGTPDVPVEVPSETPGANGLGAALVVTIVFVGVLLLAAGIIVPIVIIRSRKSREAQPLNDATSVRN